jgi:hypothetical protein
MEKKEMIKFEGSVLYTFENMPALFNDREYFVSGVAELSYEGEATQLISRNFMGTLGCDVQGFVDIYVEDTHGKPPDLIDPEMLDAFADALAETHADKLLDACSEDAMKWMKSDDNI